MMRFALGHTAGRSGKGCFSLDTKTRIFLGPTLTREPHLTPVAPSPLKQQRRPRLCTSHSPRPRPTAHPTAPPPSPWQRGLLASWAGHSHLTHTVWPWVRYFIHWAWGALACRQLPGMGPSRNWTQYLQPHRETPPPPPTASTCEHVWRTYSAPSPAEAQADATSA